MNPIRIMALRHSAFYSPLLLTMAGGYLRDEGLDHTYALATPERTVPGSIAAGTCDVAQSAVATSFAALEKGEAVDIVHFAQINARDGFFLVGRRPEPGFTWARLKGRRVLVDHFFQPLAMFRYALHRNSLDIGDIEAIDAGGVDARACLPRRSRRYALPGTGTTAARTRGSRPRADRSRRRGWSGAFSSLCARRDWLTSPTAAFCAPTGALMPSR